MSPQDFYFIDLNIPYTILYTNLWYLFKLLLVSTLLFYWLPSNIFPQEHIKNRIEKIVFNFIYMVAYIELIVTFLIFIKVFSLLFFLLSLIFTKLAFLKFYYKKNIFEVINQLRITIMLRVLDILDNPKRFKEEALLCMKEFIIHKQHTITLYSLTKNILFSVTFLYIFTILISRGLLSYSDPVPDTAQYMEWVGALQQNILFDDYATFGANFYGISILIFIVNVFTNIDQIILFSLYPIILIIALYLTLYYIVKDFSNSKYIALFAVIIHGLVFMSPVSDILLGEMVVTSNPNIVDFYGLKFYMPSSDDIISNGNPIGYIPYLRYISGMAYEHASIFVFLNIYFLIKTLETHYSKHLILYTLTLMLVFTFHGGGAIVLIIASVFVALNAFLFRKINFKLLKRGALSILTASILGNLWILSMIKYGIPDYFGAAAPILDKLLHTKHNAESIAHTSIDMLTIINMSFIHLLMFIALALASIASLFYKKRFIHSSLLLIVLAIFLTYFGPNAGAPLFTKQSRLADYLFFALTLLSALCFRFFIYKPLTLFFKRFSKKFLLGIVFTLFIFLILSQPTWMETKFFWRNINRTQYTSIPHILLKINKDNRPFSWTIVAYIQTYAKIRNKGYHINTQNFLFEYDPSKRYLEVPTKKVFIIVENFPNAYVGMHEWFYRWRKDIQNNLKSWVAIYKMNHTNLHLYSKTRTITVYEIDNTEYLDYLIKKAKR